MARPKRAGMLSTLDDLLAGSMSARPGRDRAADRHPPRLPAPPTLRRRGIFNALDLLPGPPQPPAINPERPTRRRARDPGAGRNALDELLPGPGQRLAVTVDLPAELVEAAEDAVAWLSGAGVAVTLPELTEQAVRVEVARLAAAYRGGRPFPSLPREARW